MLSEWFGKPKESNLMMTTEKKTPLQARMEEIDWTPEDVASAIKQRTDGEVRITAESVQNWMAGRTKPASSMAYFVAQVLGKSTADLFPQD